MRLREALGRGDRSCPHAGHHEMIAMRLPHNATANAYRVGAIPRAIRDETSERGGVSPPVLRRKPSWEEQGDLRHPARKCLTSCRARYMRGSRRLASGLRFMLIASPLSLKRTASSTTAFARCVNSTRTLHRRRTFTPTCRPLSRPLVMTKQTTSPRPAQSLQLNPASRDI